MGQPRYTVGLVVHPVKPVLDSVRIISRFVHRHGGALLVREDDAPRVGPDVEAVAADAFVDRLDAVVSLGGDGTMLGAMRLVVGRSTPVLGVNYGDVGFLVEVPPEGLETALNRLVAGDYTLEPHSCFQVLNGGEECTAFNDVVIAASEPLQSATVDLFVNGARHGYYRGDAVIACTPTGSTAYNYAAGGPVISPSAPSITLTPVAPMSGINRSVVLGGSDAVEFRNPSDRVSLRFMADGTPVGLLRPGVGLSVRLIDDAVNVVRFEPTLHEQRQRVKLSLLDLPLRPDQLLDLVPPQLRERAEQLRAERIEAERLRGGPWSDGPPPAS
ncbi:NAD(+) kinase [Micromonospora craterilacus]|uniref:NAD kinase n=1 Tax=Micromonospora craterilacus TaxID=1655439 RepID=A0A2W2E1N1_9ACTN|nr:NAD(+)/NADH kinase [Micromonospora craterilacus]PZG18136.1 NAD(+) kinase [Micromonospora craterilacus]